MSVKDRLKEYINYKKLSVRAFETTCGFSYGYVANIRVSMQPDKVMSIAEHFPDCNTAWLLTGEGTMLKEEGISDRTVTVNAEAWDIIKKQADSLASKDRQMEDLIQLLKKDNAHPEEDAECADASGSGLVK